MSDTCNDNLSTQEFYKDKYAIVIDLKTVDDETVVGSGRRLVGTQSGVLLEIEKLATIVDLMCHVFVISDGLVSLQTIGYKNRILTYKNINMNIPFHMVIVGMTNCGKTFCLLKMLEEEYKGHFDHIFIVFPTFKENKRTKTGSSYKTMTCSR